MAHTCLGDYQPGEANVLAGTDFDLFIGETPVNITGNRRTAMTINGGIPGPCCAGAKATRLRYG